MPDEEVTTDPLLETVVAMANDHRFDSIIEQVYLPMAEQAVVARLWPFDETKTFDDVPERHHLQTCEIALYLLNRSGAEGETRHVENGTTHEWKSGGIPEDFFRGMTPMGGVPS